MKTNIGVFCKCGSGRLVFACTVESAEKDTLIKKDIRTYWNSGHRQGLVSKEEVKSLFGCNCDLKKTKAVSQW